MGYRYPNERSHRRSSLSAPALLHNPAPPGWYQFEKNPLLQGRKFRPVTIDEAAESDKSLDIWVLAASRSVDEQIASSLDRHAETYGVEVVLLDFGVNGLPR